MIARFERKYLPNLKNNIYYKYTKLILLAPFLLTISIFIYVFKHIVKRIRIKRKNKPDLVLENIVKGWTNLVLHNEVTEKVAMHRANICAKCPAAVFSGGIHTIVVDNRTTQVRGLKCSDCGCPLSAKVRSDGDYCPRGLW